jgi:hypothetical protein
MTSKQAAMSERTHVNPFAYLLGMAIIYVVTFAGLAALTVTVWEFIEKVRGERNDTGN